MSPTSPSVALPSPKERRRLREALPLSEEQVAEALGVTRATVRAWETGRSTPRGRKREAYAKLLGVYEEPTAPRTDKPARPAPAATRPRPAAKGADRPPKAPTAPLAKGSHGAQSREPGRAHAASNAPEHGEEPAATATGPSAPAQPREAAATATGPSAPPGPGMPAPTEPEASAPTESGKPTATDASSATETDQPTVTESGASAPAERGRPAAARRAGRRAARGGAGSVGPAAAEPEVPAVEKAAAPGLTPEDAFDALYAYAAPGLVHQTYLLTGRRRLSRESVEHAFHHAWERWPEVACDRDPVGWVRAAAYEYALSPWHRFRRRHRHPDAPPTEASRRALLRALLDLPAPYRRTVLLYDGLGLDLPETAAETEASTPATGNRLLHARTVIAQRVPELAEAEALQQRLGALVAEAPTATLPEACAVRTGSERRSRLLTRTVIAVTAALIAATAFTVVTAPTRYIPVNAPGQVVEGVPVRGGPQKLRPEDKALHELLRTAPHPGPERLVPGAE
ncbi:helix-turn-helix domain-containing protein [Streptomyces sp. NPDC101160]|uniref:helix-turn-helix domain-containing protein n=1 Tax=Streptomyces sp. NPDC101160 TaxID=3366118 RepID=UPI00382D5FC4